MLCYKIIYASIRYPICSARMELSDYEELVVTHCMGTYVAYTG